MKRFLAIVTVLMMCMGASYAQSMKVKGNFTGRGVETLTFTPIGFSEHPSQMDFENVYRISSNKKYSKDIIFEGSHLDFAQAYDIDGDGRDELAFVTFGQHGCWGSLVVLDYVNGAWYNTGNSASIYECNEDVPARLIYPGKNKNTYKAMSWDMSNNIYKKYRYYTFKRKRYIPTIKYYYDAAGKRYKL